MTASSASTAESTRLRPRVGAGRARSAGSVPVATGPPVLVSRFTVSVAETNQAPRGRAECLAARRLERRRRHLIASAALGGIALLLILTVVVLDVLH